MENQENIQISQSEWEVMRVLWDVAKPITAAEVVQKLDGLSDWKPKTVRTFLNRLVAKKAISAQKRMIAGYELLHYEPLVDERSTIQAEQESFLGRFFGGTVQSMLASCIQFGSISKEELKELHDMIEKEMEEK